MYSAYIREREGKEILQHEHGFTIYGYNCVPGVDFPHVYIQDVYIKPEYRKKGIASQMADQVAQQAKDAGFKIMLANIDGNAKGAHESLLVLIAYGMRLFTVDNSAVWMSKEI